MINNNKKKKKKPVVFSFAPETMERLDRLSRAIVPNKSRLVEKLLIQWLDRVDQQMKQQDLQQELESI